MAGPQRAARSTQQGHEVIACFAARSTGTGMTWSAAAVDLACGDPGQPDAGSLPAPDRTIAVPDRDGSAGEALAGGHDHRSGSEEQE